ncbi:hypothetical protein [Paludisphaera soli]|uniref:hypothetical protein n=1 Tax=Paludisphaera soli TaxID=2712865 RepID=UPI0013E9B414|nr:hypothetical protein [Paludisphaera soli]
MGIALGWVAAALAAAGAGSPPDEAKPEITYRFRTVAVRGLAWREAGLKPVVQHNAVSVWTSADDFLDRLPGEARAVAAGTVEAKGFAQAPVHVTTRKSHDFVTQVIWKGKGKAPKPVTESVREGLVATVVGRKIDQGVLAQLVIDDVDVRSVHTLGSPAAKAAHASTAACPTHDHADKPAGVTVTITASMDSEKGVDADVNWADRNPSKASAILALCKAQDEGKSPCCEAGAKAAAKTDDAASRASWAPAETPIQIPEVGRAAAAGEWLIPDGEVLIVAFGPHTVADADGKAVVREHLAVISAEVADEPETTPPPPAAGIVPALPATADQPEAPRTAAALPELPSRTLPQGVNADGTPAPLPTLPEDDEPAAAAGDESAEPFATPQSRRKAGRPAETPAPPAESPKPEAEAVPEPAAPAKTDIKAIKSSFKLPSLKNLQALEPLNNLVGSGVFPIPFQGAQFLVPLKALGVKLPFNQKLEFELIGRIVNDAEANDAHFVVGN